MRVDSCLSCPSCLCSVSRSKFILSLLQSHCLCGEQWEGLRAFPQPRVNGCTPSPDRQKSRLCLQSCWGNSDTAAGNCSPEQWNGNVVFWFQQYIENQNVVRNSKRLQKPKDKSKSIPCVFTTFKQLQLKLGHCQPLSKGCVVFFLHSKQKKGQNYKEYTNPLYTTRGWKISKTIEFFLWRVFSCSIQRWKLRVGAGTDLMG